LSFLICHTDEAAGPVNSHGRLPGAGGRLAREHPGGEIILVTGSIVAREEAFDDLLRACLEHVERPRKEIQR
jgi:hypothetical protein